MMRESRRKSVTHEFVEFVPSELRDGTVYVSMEYATAVHLCACGCRSKVVTPLTPTDWKLVFDGESISLDPSIGNWNFPCRSHYWIERNVVRWAGQWSQEEIAEGREYDRNRKEKFYADRSRPASLDQSGSAAASAERPKRNSLLPRLWRKKK